MIFRVNKVKNKQRLTVMKKNSEKFIDNTANYNIVDYFKKNFLVGLLEKYNLYLINQSKNVNFLNTKHFLIPHNNNKYYLCVIPKYLIDKTSTQNYDILYFFNSTGDSFFVELNINNFNVLSSNKSSHNIYLFECFLYSINNTQTNHTGLDNYDCYISDILIYKNEICELDYVSRHSLLKNFYIFKNKKETLNTMGCFNSIYSNDVQFNIVDYITINDIPLKSNELDFNTKQLLTTYIQNSKHKTDSTHIDKIMNKSFNKETCIISFIDENNLVELKIKDFTIEKYTRDSESTTIITDIYYLYDTFSSVYHGVLYIPSLKHSKYIKNKFLIDNSFSILHKCKFNKKFKKWELENVECN
jgi:hypothetical protein